MSNGSAGAGRTTRAPRSATPRLEAWSELVRAYNPGYQLFLKHWLESKMPPAYRQGLAFISDSQEFTSLEQMLADFEAWGKAFSASPVGFQFGYTPDGAWWQTAGRSPGRDRQGHPGPHPQHLRPVLGRFHHAGDLAGGAAAPEQR